ncbi:MAG TPA: VOC family protein [Xanthobacteraceae bacterium]|nr:VOC family protein [Xanthobacteraceae bacterium]
MTMVPKATLTVVTLGVADLARSIRFYEALGFRRHMADAEGVAFFEAGGAALALFPWDALAADAAVPDQPRPQAFRGTTLAWNCNSPAEVDEVFAHALACGAAEMKKPQPTFYGGYCCYFADPDGHLWEVVQAPGITVSDDGRVALPD